MYQVVKEPFGEWEKIKIWDKKTGNGFSLVPACGATLLELNFGEKNILDGYQTPEELAAGDWCKSAFLFPFPNRLNDGKYQVGGKAYQFPINDESGHNALHGFETNQPFEIQAVETRANFAKITCTYRHDGTHLAYPFPFTVEVSFSINNTQEFEVGLFFTSQAKQPIPVGLGWHPYFVLGKNVGNYTLQLPDCQRVEVDKAMIPTGTKTPYNVFTQKKKLDKVSLDTCFELEQKDGRAHIVMEGTLGEIKYWQEAGSQLWNFFQIFTPPNRDSVAIESMTCNVDAFNNEDGLVLLEKGKTLGGLFGLSFEEK